MTSGAHIAGAIEKGELFLVYQPQVAARTGHIVSVESLVRWTDPLRGERVPGDFVADAEKIQLSVDQPRSGEELQKRIADAYKAPPEIIARLRKLSGH